MIKKFFQSKGIQGGLLAVVAGMLITIAPNVTGIISRYFENDDAETQAKIQANIQDIESIVVQFLGYIAVGGGGYGMYGRAIANGPLVGKKYSETDSRSPDFQSPFPQLTSSGLRDLHDVNKIRLDMGKTSLEQEVAHASGQFSLSNEGLDLADETFQEARIIERERIKEHNSEILPGFGV
ncbi:MAG: hypothetical protein KTR18_04000 [Acidiferrobacterales bacterium]|nr:hypothetical protein [Acidiferrobacterales bacterium]